MPFAKKVWSEVTEDEVFTWGSALAYSWLFAIFPFMIFLLTLAPYLPGQAKEKAMSHVEGVAYTSLGGEAGYNIVKSVQDVMSQQKGGLLSLGLVLALWGASGGMSMTMSALDKAYYVHCNRSFLKQRLVAIALTIAAAVLILAVMFLLPIGTAVLTYLTNHGHLGIVGKILIDILRYALALSLLFTIVALIYYFGPCIRQKWQSITPGAVFTVAVWIILGLIFSFYVTHFGNFNKTYGALGAAIILLLFFYINAVVLLIGAEINSVIDFETLNIKPGATDLTQAKAKAKYDKRHAGEEHARPEGPARHDPIHLPIVSQTPRRHRARKALIYASSLVAARWAWKKFWMSRAKRKHRQALARARQPWWRRWAMS
jgi:membrane protein